MSTIEQVALLAKVSVATVSRVINNTAKVNEDTRLRVENAIKKLNYQPNAMGVMLRRETTGLVLILLHSVDNPFFSSTVQGIERIAHDNNYNVLICNTYGDRERESHYLKMLKNHLVDGVLLLSNTLTVEEIDELNAQYPIVQVIEYSEESKAAYFSVDFYEASRSILKELILPGHKNIAFVHAGSVDIISANEKYRAYRDTMIENDRAVLTPRPQDVVFGFASGKQVTAEILSNHPDVEAFFVTSDLIACGVIDELNAHGYQVPQDKAVVGFDNTIFAYLSHPSITSIELNSFQMGSDAMSFLLKKIRHCKEELKKKNFLPYEIIKRNSI
ncbi:MAG: LacI family DNA-binding transcriptional regulator [Erysipelotrichaceae bacterium]|nr:LacI family DNA-binding transcriptional regulator [Erysipelotrichaceae bacterium]